MVRTGRDLDQPGADAGLADSLGQLLLVDRGDVVERQVAEGVGEALLFEVGAGRADDAHARGLCDLGHELDVAPEIHRAGVEEGAHAEGAQAVHLVDRPPQGLAALEARGERVHLPARVADEQVLVHERAAELVGAAGAGHRLDGLHGGLQPRSPALVQPSPG